MRYMCLGEIPLNFGTASYDLAKLIHSVIAMDDFIIAGRYEIIASPSGSDIGFDIDKRLALAFRQWLLDLGC